jgi:hypothetical protein
MKKPILVVILLTAVVVGLPLVSRTIREPGAPAGNVQPHSTAPVQSASLGPGVADEAITLWSLGWREEALSLLLEGKPPGSTPVTPLECLSINEVQFSQLPVAEQSRIAQQYQQAAKAARNLSKAAIAKINRGEQANAALCTSRLKDFAGQLAGPDYSLILQLTGQAIRDAVERDLG